MSTSATNPARSRIVRWLEALGQTSGAFQVSPRSGTDHGASSPAGCDAEVAVALANGTKHLRFLVVHKKRIHPKDAIATVAPLAANTRKAGHNTLAVLAAPYVSPGVAEVCRNHQVGYVDGAGNCHLVGPGLFLHIEGRPNQLPDTRPAERLFAPKSSRIARVLLEQPSTAWRVQALAATAQVSIGLASRIKQRLVDESFAKEAPDGLRVTAPDRLLTAWSDAYKAPRQRVPVYSLDSAEATEEAIVRWGDRNGVTCALAEFSAAARLAPMVRSKRGAVYVEADLESEALHDLMRDLGLKEVDSGPTVELWLTKDRSVFQNTQVLSGVRVVSALQAYLDVQKNPARGQEAATALYDRFLKPRFAEVAGAA